MNKFKRVLSFFLTLVMLVGMMPPLSVISNAKTYPIVVQGETKDLKCLVELEIQLNGGVYYYTEFEDLPNTENGTRVAKEDLDIPDGYTGDILVRLFQEYDYNHYENYFQYIAGVYIDRDGDGAFDDENVMLDDYLRADDVLVTIYSSLYKSGYDLKALEFAYNTPEHLAFQADITIDDFINPMNPDVLFAKEGTKAEGIWDTSTGWILPCIWEKNEGKTVTLHAGPEGNGKSITTVLSNDNDLLMPQQAIYDIYGLKPHGGDDDQRVFIGWFDGYDSASHQGTGTEYRWTYTGEDGGNLYAIWGYPIMFDADGGYYSDNSDRYLAYVADYGLYQGDATDAASMYKFIIPDLLGDVPVKTGARRVGGNDGVSYALVENDWETFYTWEGTGQNLTIPPVGGANGIDLEWSDFRCTDTDDEDNPHGIRFPELIAIWEPTVIYNANTGTGTMDTDYLTWEGGTIYNYEDYMVRPNSFTKDGALFTGWNTKADGTGTAYNAFDTITEFSSSDPITLYAQWTDGGFSTEKEYKITFNPNGGTFENDGTTNNRVIYAVNDGRTYGEICGADGVKSQSNASDPSSLDTSLVVTKVGYFFDGWMVDQVDIEGSDENSDWFYDESAQFLYPSDVTFTARWVKDKNCTRQNNSGDCTLTFDPGKGTIVSKYSSCKIDHQVTYASRFKNAIYPQAICIGYDFQYWDYSDGAFKLYDGNTGDWYNETVVGTNGVFDAKWSKINHECHYLSLSEVPATCDVDGLRTTVCVCGDVETETLTLDHSYTVIYKEEAPTCTEPGTKTYMCEHCGDIGEPVVGDPATGHAYPATNEEAELVPGTSECNPTYLFICANDPSHRYEVPTVGDGHKFKDPEDLGNGYTRIECTKENCGYIGVIANRYTIEYVLQNDEASLGADSPDSHTFAVDTPLVDATSPNHIFQGWYLTPDCTGEPVTTLGGYDYLSPIVLYAKWSGKDLTLTLAPNSGTFYDKTGTTSIGTGNQKIEYHVYGKDTKISDYYSIKRTGYTLTGWKLKSTGEIITDVLGGYAITANDTLTAQWNLQEFEIEYYDTDTESLIDKETSTYVTNLSSVDFSHVYNTATTLVAPTKTGYTSALYTDEACTAAVTSLGKTAYEYETNGNSYVIRLYVKWLPNVLTLKYRNTGSNQSDKTETQMEAYFGEYIPEFSLTYNDILTLPTEDVRDGYHICGFYLESGATNKVVTVNAADYLAAGDASLRLFMRWEADDATPPTGTVDLGVGSAGVTTTHLPHEELRYGIYGDYDMYSDITITGVDEDNHVAPTVEYHFSENIPNTYLYDALTLEEVEALPDSAWTEVGDGGKVSVEGMPDGAYILYAKITNDQDLVTYISSQLFVIDNTPPVFNVIDEHDGTESELKDGAEFCADTTIRIVEDNIEIITINGAPITLPADGTYTLLGTDNGTEYTIYCKDKSGNTNITTVTVHNGHLYEGHVSKPATCLEMGDTTYVCSRCQHTYTATDIPATGHAWTDEVWSEENQFGWQVTTEPTYTAEGEETRWCTNGCGETEKRPVDIKPDDIKPVIDVNVEGGVTVTETEQYAPSFTATMTATDEQTGIRSEYYYVSDVPMTDDELGALTDEQWTSGTSVTLDKENGYEDGTYYVYFKAVDKANDYTDHEDNTAYAGTVKLVVDSVKPVVDPDETTPYDDTKVTISDDNLDPDKIVVKDEDGNVIDPSDYTVTGPDEDGNYTIVLPEPTGDEGDKEYTVTVTDKAGNESDPVEVVIKDDVSAPTVDYKDEDGKSLNDSTVTVYDNAEKTVTITVNDPETGLEDVVYKVNGEAVTLESVIRSEDGKTETAIIKLPAEEDGKAEYQITVEATNGDGDTTGEVLSSTVIIDTKAPVVDVPERDYLYDDVTVKITDNVGYDPEDVKVTVTDKDGNITEFEVEVGEDGTIVLPEPEPGTGDVTYTITATDWVGNESEPVEVVIKDDNTAPTFDASASTEDETFTQDGITDYTNKDVTIKVKNIVDNESDVDKVTIKVTDEDGNVTEYTTTLDEYKDIVLKDDGTYNVAVTVTDKEGNSDTVKLDEIVIDRVKPELTPDEKPYVSTTVTVTDKTDPIEDLKVTVTYKDNETGETVTTEIKPDENGNILLPEVEDNGDTTYTVTVEDKAGNVTTGEFTVLDDDTPPTVGMTSSTGDDITDNEDDYINEDNGKVTVTAEDDEIGIDVSKYTVTYTDTDGNVTTETKDFTDSDVIDISKEGIYEITVYAKDKDGNESKIDTNKIIVVDQTAPVITPEGGEAYVDGGKYVYCGVESVAHTVADTYLNTVTVNEKVVTDYTLAGTPEGATYIVVATDKAGNSTTVTVTVYSTHDYTSEVTVEPTCTKEGVRIYTCTRCDHTYTEVIPALGHDYVEHEAKAPTCTEIGWKAYETCTRCDYTTYVELPATGHAYDNGVVTTDPTCTEAGVKTYTCANDANHTYTETVDALGHDMVTDAAVAPTCTATGLTEGSHCSRCDDATTKQEVVAALGHDMGEWVVTTPATCTTDGVKRSDCNRCDYFETDKIPATGHAYDNGVVTTDPTCTEAGVKTYTCANDANHTYTETVDALGHDMVTDAAVAPTCTATGLTEGSHCSRCDDATTKQEVVAALGHKYVGTVTKEATCTEKGTKTYVCQNDTSHTYTEDIAAKGHNYLDTVTKPTCTEKGYTTHVCTECNDTYVDTYVDALDHDYENCDWAITTAPSIDANGNNVPGIITYYCNRDVNHTYTEKIYPVAQNTATGKIYTVLQEAINEATEGQTVKLLVDFTLDAEPETEDVFLTHTYTEIDVRADAINIILDLNGHKLKVTNTMSVHMNGDVIDSTVTYVYDSNGKILDQVTEGRLILAAEMISESSDGLPLPAGNSCLPVKTNEVIEGYNSYKLFSYVNMQQQNAKVAEGSYIFKFRPSLGSMSLNEAYFSDGALNEGLKMAMRIKYYDGTSHKYMDIIYADAGENSVKVAYSTNQLFKVTVNGVDTYINAYEFTFTSVIISETGVQYEGKQIQINDLDFETEGTDSTDGTTLEGTDESAS